MDVALLADRLLEFGSIFALRKCQMYSSSGFFPKMVDNGDRILRRNPLPHCTKEVSKSPVSSQLDQFHLTPWLLGAAFFSLLWWVQIGSIFTTHSPVILLSYGLLSSCLLRENLGLAFLVHIGLKERTLLRTLLSLLFLWVASLFPCSRCWEHGRQWDLYCLCLSLSDTAQKDPP